MIARAEEVRDELGRWTSYLNQYTADDAGVSALVWELAGADAMGVALNIHEGGSECIKATELAEPMYMEMSP